MNDLTPYQATIMNVLLIVIVSTANHKQALLHTSIVDFVDYVILLGVPLLRNSFWHHCTAYAVDNGCNGNRVAFLWILPVTTMSFTASFSKINFHFRAAFLEI